MSWSITPNPPVYGSAGRSARPSVNVRYRTQTFTPVAVSLQAEIRSGFPSGVFGNNPKYPGFSSNFRIALSTASGFATATVKFADAAFRPIFASVPTGGVTAAGALGRLFLSEVPA